MSSHCLMPADLFVSADQTRVIVPANLGWVVRADHRCCTCWQRPANRLATKPLCTACCPELTDHTHPTTVTVATGRVHCTLLEFLLWKCNNGTHEYIFEDVSGSTWGNHIMKLTKVQFETTANGPRGSSRLTGQGQKCTCHIWHFQGNWDRNEITGE